jgi:DNA helicase-2/ATP-dependent DNA helicase PcrA
LSQRWPLAICDEFQDTDDEQWELLRSLARSARLVLLADPNQMIYDGFLGERGVGPRRLEQALAEADCVIDLGAPSHRDQTNVIPAMASAARMRQFDHPAVHKAIEEERLKIYGSVEDGQLIDVLQNEIARARAIGESVGIFAHGNQPVADLSADLFAIGIDHVLVGLPEAHSEALAALEALCLFGAGRLPFEDARRHLALFLAASVRRDEVPLAVALDGRAPLAPTLQKRLDAARESLQAVAEEGLPEVVHTAMEVWPSLEILAGRRSWNQAARTFGAMAQLSSVRSRNQPDTFFAELARRVQEQRAESFFDLDIGAGYSIHVMNFHQTKGREVDVVILVFRGNDWFGREGEPFIRNSRLLYVSLTRARHHCVVILPPTPHPLVAPFAGLLP